MHKISVIFFWLILHITSLYGQSFKEKTLKTKIGEVTVFLKSALITRNGQIQIPSGHSKILIKKLSPFIDAKSVQVSGEGNFTILSVNHRVNYLEELDRSEKIDSLTNLIDEIESKVNKEQARKTVLKEKLSLLSVNKDLSSQTTSITVSQLREAIEYYEKEITAIETEKLKIAQRLQKLEEEEEKLNNQLEELSLSRDEPIGEIEVRIKADRSTRGEFTISYLVSEAGWYPNYNIRVKDVSSPIALDYKADVYQNTGVDWNNVQLRFSNADPNVSGVAPELQTWFLNYPRNSYFSNISYDDLKEGSVTGVVVDEQGNPVPGVNVLVKGSTIGTVTDINGRYSLTLPANARQLVFSFIGLSTKEVAINSSSINVQMDSEVQQLSEVVISYSSKKRDKFEGRVRGVSSIKSQSLKTQVVENPVSVDFLVEVPYSLPSSGEKLSVDLVQYEINAEYKYYSVPKLNKDAFLIASVIDWNQYNLLAGEANLYFEDAYVGRTVLDTKTLTDTLDISLGRDKNVVVNREKINDYSRKRTIGSNKVDTRGFKIKINNRKSSPVSLTILDQLPVSAISDITVKPIELSGAQLEDESGKLTWKIMLDSKKSREIDLKYEVKYPKREHVILE